ncbi:unnamed protein product [Rotaria sp. Silwood2]|nr:unnamed protein product [Rotaria sp. Silwood2]
MGLTVVPYQMRTSANTDFNQQFRRYHMRAPLRSLIAPMRADFSPPLEINTRSLRNRQSNLLASNDVEQRQFRRQSLLSSPSLITENIRRINTEINRNSTLATNIFDHSLRQRSRSSAK